jgi:hypothetical protein
LNTPIGNDGTIKEIFFSNTANDIRESVIDGSYRYCNELQCPSLSELTIDKVHEWFVPKTEENIHLLRSTTNPREINFNFDESCNFKCPSCRKDYINYKDDKKDMVDRKLREIDEELSENIEKMYISGNSDPFFSVSFRKFLLNFDNTKYPSLKNIHIHTNGSLWNDVFDFLWSVAYLLYYFSQVTKRNKFLIPFRKNFFTFELCIFQLLV